MNIVAIVIGLAVGAVGGCIGALLVAWWTRGRVIDNEVKVAYVLSTAGEALGGFDICERAEIGSGSVYSVLAKFERMGMVASVWEEEKAEDRRRMWLWTAAPMKVNLSEEKS